MTKAHLFSHLSGFLVVGVEVRVVVVVVLHVPTVVAQVEDLKHENQVKQLG